MTPHKHIKGAHREAASLKVNKEFRTRTQPRPLSQRSQRSIHNVRSSSINPGKRVRSRMQTAAAGLAARHPIPPIALFSFLLVALIFLLAGLLFYLSPSLPTSGAITEKSSDEQPLEPPIMGTPGSAHYHATFLTFINGEMRRFDEPQYFAASPYAHLHDYSFAEMHIHATNVTLGFFFNTLGIDFTEQCITLLRSNESYCTNATHKLTFLAEGKPHASGWNYVPKDWEHYIVSYGSENEEELKKQAQSVPDPLASPVPEGVPTAPAPANPAEPKLPSL